MHISIATRWQAEAPSNARFQSEVNPRARPQPQGTSEMNCDLTTRREIASIALMTAVVVTKLCVCAAFPNLSGSTKSSWGFSSSWESTNPGKGGPVCINRKSARVRGERKRTGWRQIWNPSLALASAQVSTRLLRVRFESRLVYGCQDCKRHVGFAVFRRCRQKRFDR